MPAPPGDCEPLPQAAPVVIAGGGPVGLAVAVELAHHGVPSLVLERRAEISWLRPRAKTTSARSMEHFRRWGLAARLRERAGLPVRWSDQAVFCTGLTGREITRFDHCFGLDLTGSDLVAEPGQQVAQPVVEQVLREAVAASPLAGLRTGLEVVAAGEAADGAWVEAVDSRGIPHRVRADWVVGCEGPRSVVRAAIGARYEGGDSGRPNLNIVFRAPGLAARVRHGPAVHYWILQSGQPGLVGRLDLDGTWWCSAQGVDGTAADVDPARIVRRLIGCNVPVEVLATDAWRARMLLADRYSGGRLLIAGDAAHQNPPWGGHGFNTGLGDAVNLAWKLAAVVSGWAPASLLDSYQPERRPVAARTIDEAAGNMAALAPELADPRLTGDDGQFEQARPAAAAAIQAAKASEFHSLGLTLGYDYADSPLVSPDHRPGPAPPRGNGDYAPTAAPGHRLPHRWLAPGDSLYDHLGREFTLAGDLSTPGAARLAAAASALGVPLHRLDLDDADTRRRFGAALVLVRPDQHVAWRGEDPADPAAIIGRAAGRTV